MGLVSPVCKQCSFRSLLGKKNGFNAEKCVVLRVFVVLIRNMGFGEMYIKAAVDTSMRLTSLKVLGSICAVFLPL